ncbi:UvrD-helicase domain-containing protein [Paucibacter sp. XJ19-41]|uniref:UvrD-helicase domain-containing protein n=1 Tax=Paucibacter sp. XJ19-41 TaxID=2927824 RepID=UPI002349E00A|nr:UvrD-helicase domain-containing protein [Paucibacter sp. XJ19-41]MDC6169079.1 UvrD-helicase domain-containing protein [Paucibacter sp. XJ19-41]
MQEQAAYTCDGAPVARERFYALACDPQRSVVVEACAGAGKTWMLVSRILRALLEGAQPQDIVAITFTRKAAGEMRQRLGEWLDEFAHCSEAQRREALIQRGMPVEQAAALAPALAGLQQQLLQAGRMVEIRTFHAWFSQLLRAAPLELLEAQGIAPELQLLEDESELMPELWQRFHAAVLADQALLAAYQALVFEQGRNRVLSWLESAFAKRVEIRLAAQAGRLHDSVADAASVAPEFAGLAHPLEAFAALRADLATLARVLGQAKNATPKKAAVAIEQGLSLPDEQAVEAVIEALFTATGTPRKNLGESLELQSAIERLERLKLALAQHQARDWHLQMCRLSLCLLDEFEALKRARGLVDMNDLERGALALLSDAPLAGWVQERLDTQIRHLLIDEFQDTSPLQWHALYAWLAGYVGAGGGASGQRPPSVFIVGDPKQSIYRFRRAEPRVFAAARDFVRDGLAGTVLACDHTRRNAPPVLAAVNTAFDAASRAQEYSGFRPHTTEAGAASALDGVFFIDDDGVDSDIADTPGDELQAWRPSLSQARHEPELHRRAAEAQRIAGCIEQLLSGEGVQPGEIYVLARKREGLRVLAQTLKARGLPHVAPEDMALLDSPDVRDLLALLDALASPGHNLSLAHALRSPLFGASEADLLQLAACSGSADWLGRPRPEEAARMAWWAALTLADEQDLSPALRRARELLNRWERLAGERSPHDLLDAIVFEGDLMARLACAVPPSERRSRLHAVEALLALALDLDGGRYASLYGFVRALKSRALKLAAPAEPEAVQLLTVHGAKGLEARVVFLMDCEAGPARAESSSLAIAWPVQESAPSVVAFLASESRPPPSLQPLLDDEREQRQREELNALYVAMTRARSRLVLSRSPSQRKPANATWWSRLQPLAMALQVTVEAVGESAAAAAPFQLKTLPLAPPRAAMPVVEMGQGPAVVDDSAALGEALHRVLEWASGPSATAQPLPRLLAAAAQMYGLDAKRSERLERSARTILDSAECAPFFDAPALLWAGNEVPVSWQGQDMRLDRLVCRHAGSGQAPIWWVLDYKLHPAPQNNPEYLQQLQRYREAVLRLQPGEPVRTAFITGQGRLVDCTERVEQISLGGE